MSDVKAVAQEILDRTEGQIGTHSTDCHKYHLACFAAFVMHELEAPAADLSALLSDKAIQAAKLAGFRALDGAEQIEDTSGNIWDIGDAISDALQAAIDAVTEGDAE